MIFPLYPMLSHYYNTIIIIVIYISLYFIHIHYTLYIIHYTLYIYIILYTLYFIHYTLYFILYTLYIIHHTSIIHHHHHHYHHHRHHHHHHSTMSSHYTPVIPCSLPTSLRRNSAGRLPLRFRETGDRNYRAQSVLGLGNRPTGIEGADPGRFTGEFYGMAVDLAELELCFFGV